MLSTASHMLQILITVWVGAHPVTYTIPHKYPSTTHACQDHVGELFARRIPKSYKQMRLECVNAPGSDA